jgi:hypothetical protein
MPPTLIQRMPLRDVMLVLPERISRIAPAAADLPVFSDDGVAAIQRGDTGASEDHRTWRSMPAWLSDVQQDAAKATVLCRKTALTVTVDARQPPDLPADVQLLPLAEEPKAQLQWVLPNGEVVQHAMASMLDVGRRRLTLALKFEDSDAGRDLYGKVVEAVSAAAFKPTIAISCVHTYARRVPAEPSGPIVVDPPPRTRWPRWGGGVIVRDSGTTRVRPAMAARAVEPGALRAADFSAEAPALHAEVARMPLDRTTLLADRAIVRDHRVFVPPAADTIAAGSFTAVTTVPIARRREDTTAFPDLPRQARNGWDQVPDRPAGAPPLHFRDSDQVASFFYLPTRFKLGYAFDGEGAGRPPMRAEAFRDEQGIPRVKVTLTALPFIEESDRDVMRRYLRDTVLLHQVPFVRLAPAAGVRTRFLPDFTAGPPTAVETLPQSIRFETLEAAPEKWLYLQFTMDATDYPIFGALLRKGLRGRVVLETDGVSQGVPVSLALDEVVTDGVRVKQDASAPNDLAIENLLALPATLSSVRASLLDTGPLDLVFDAEERDLLPAAQRVDAHGSWSTRVEPTQIAGWDTTVVSIGPVLVDGGSVDDWIDAVHRDSSLQPQSFKVSVSVTVPAAAADTLELVQCRLFKDGSAVPRQEFKILPAAPSTELVVQVSLAELMGHDGVPASFSLEFESLQKDGSLSLPQRVAVRLSDRQLVLVALVEKPGTRFTVDYVGADGVHREEMDRAAAVTLVERLRQEGGHWQMYARHADTTPVTPRDPTEDPPPTGPEVSVVTDLLGPAFAAGALKKLFVVIQAAADGSPSSTLAFDPDHQEAQRWRPASGTIPPFKYVVTYVYGTGTKRVEGTETNLLLLLDPPAAP